MNNLLHVGTGMCDGCGHQFKTGYVPIAAGTILDKHSRLVDVGMPVEARLDDGHWVVVKDGKYYCTVCETTLECGAFLCEDIECNLPLWHQGTIHRSYTEDIDWYFDEGEVVSRVKSEGGWSEWVEGAESLGWTRVMFCDVQAGDRVKVTFTEGSCSGTVEGTIEKTFLGPERDYMFRFEGSGGEYFWSPYSIVKIERELVVCPKL